jgi:hypothetical protein
MAFAEVSDGMTGSGKKMRQCMTESSARMIEDFLFGQA